MPGRQLDSGGQRPRSGELDLQGAGVSLGLSLQGVEIASEQVAGAAQVPAGARGHPPAGGLNLDRQVDEQPRRPADEFRADSSGRQFRDVGQIGELAEDGAKGLVSVGARP